MLRLEDAAGVEVRVSDERAAPVARARVQLRVGAAGTPDGWTDDRGIARLVPVIPGSAGIEVSAVGFAPAIVTVAVGSPGARGRVAVTLRRGAVIAGHVVDDEDQPIARAHVVAVGEDRNLYESASATTDASGSFELGPLAPQRYTIRAVDGEHAPAQSRPVVLAATPLRDVRVEMRAGGRVYGTVVDAQGEPVRFARVSIFEGETARVLPDWRRATTDATRWGGRTPRPSAPMARSSSRACRLAPRARSRTSRRVASRRRWWRPPARMTRRRSRCTCSRPPMTRRMLNRFSEVALSRSTDARRRW